MYKHSVGRVVYPHAVSSSLVSLQRCAVHSNPLLSLVGLTSGSHRRCLSLTHGLAFGPKSITPSRVPVSKRRGTDPQKTPSTTGTAAPLTADSSAAPDTDTAFLTSYRTRQFPKKTTYAAPATPTAATAAPVPVTPVVAPPAPTSATTVTAATTAAANPSTAAATPPAATAAPGATPAHKLDPVQLKKLFPFAKNISSQQPQSTLQNNPYKNVQWFLTAAQAASTPPNPFLATTATAILPEAYITTSFELKELLRYLQRTEVVAIDTEFASNTTYRPTLEVLQIGTSEILAAVDCQLLRQSSEFKELLVELMKKEWVIHAHRGDLEVLTDMMRTLEISPSLPAKIFDTQIAVSFLSTIPAIAYGLMVEKVLQIPVDKSATLSDWAARPLSLQQIQYALSDVKYLLPIRNLLEKFLKNSSRDSVALDPTAATKTGESIGERWHWFQEEMTLLLNPTLYIPMDPSLAHTALFWRGGEGLVNESHLIFVAVAEWREKMAREKNTIPNFLLTVDQMSAISKMPPKTLTELQDVSRMKRWFVVEHGNEIIKMIEDIQKKVAQAGSAADLVELEPESFSASTSVQKFAWSHRLNGRMNYEVFDLISAASNSCSTARQISVGVLAPYRDRIDLASLSRESVKTVSGWPHKDLACLDANHSEDKQAFLPSLLPASVNYRFANGVTEDVMFERLVPEAVKPALKTAMNGEPAPAATPSTIGGTIQLTNPSSPLPLDTEVSLLRFSKVLRGWRRSLIGQELLQLLEGQHAYKLAWTASPFDKSDRLKLVEATTTTTSALAETTDNDSLSPAAKAKTERQLARQAAAEAKAAAKEAAAIAKKAEKLAAKAAKAAARK